MQSIVCVINAYLNLLFLLFFLNHLQYPHLQINQPVASSHKSVSMHKIKDYVFNVNNPPIGKGAFAKVYLGKSEVTGKLVALKRINREDSSPFMMDHLYLEIKIMFEAKHKNIVVLQEMYFSHSYIYLVMDFCEGGHLGHFIKENPVLPEIVSRHLISQITSALMYLSDRGIVHRDLKPDNLLLARRVSKHVVPKIIDTKEVIINDLPTIKLADFGFSRYIRKYWGKTVCGTPFFMAPEIAQAKYHDCRVDLWSLGVIMYELFTKRLPFQDNDLFDIINKKTVVEDYLEFPPSASAAAFDVLTRLLKIEPDDRITIKDLFDHPFLNLSPSLEELQPMSTRVNTSALIHKPVYKKVNYNQNFFQGLNDAVIRTISPIAPEFMEAQLIGTSITPGVTAILNKKEFININDDENAIVEEPHDYPFRPDPVSEYTIYGNHNELSGLVIGSNNIEEFIHKEYINNKSIAVIKGSYGPVSECQPSLIKDARKYNDANYIVHDNGRAVVLCPISQRVRSELCDIALIDDGEIIEETAGIQVQSVLSSVATGVEALDFFRESSNVAKQLIIPTYSFEPMDQTGVSTVTESKESLEDDYYIINGDEGYESSSFKQKHGIIKRAKRTIYHFTIGFTRSPISLYIK